jgi:hypothetical protein
MDLIAAFARRSEFEKARALLAANAVALRESIR